MDYYSKYLKYKLKYKNLLKQIGGATIWEYQLDDRSWRPYDPEEIWFIEHHEGTFRLPISGFVVNKNEFYQQGKVNRRAIRRREINDDEFRRIETEAEVRKTIAILQAFPQISQILRLNAGMAPHDFRGELHRIINSNDSAFRRITAAFPDEYCSQNSDLFMEIVRNRIPSTQDAIRSLLERRRVRFELARREQQARDAARKREEDNDEWRGYPGAQF